MSDLEAFADWLKRRGLIVPRSEPPAGLAELTDPPERPMSTTDGGEGTPIWTARYVRDLEAFARAAWDLIEEEWGGLPGYVPAELRAVLDRLTAAGLFND